MAAHAAVRGAASEIFLTIFLIQNVQLPLVGSSFCCGPSGGALHPRQLHVPWQRELSHCGVVLNVKKTLLCFNDNTEGESSTSRICEPISLSFFLPFFPYQGNSVVPRAAEVEEEFPFVNARISFGSWKDLTQWDAVKKGKAYGRRNTGLSKEGASVVYDY